jgi:Fe-Mn family superoxide dismutase
MGVQKVKSKPGSRHEGDMVAREFDLAAVEGLSRKAIDLHLDLYRGYVEKLNELRNRLANDGNRDVDATAGRVRQFAFEYNGVVLHELFFEALAGPGAAALDAGGVVAEAADISFGGVKNWKRDVAELAGTRGIGWVLCVREPQKNQIFNVWVDQHQLGLPARCQILLALDFWEHAYLLDFAPKARDEYFELLWRQLDWSVVERRAT